AGAGAGRVAADAVVALAGRAIAALGARLRDAARRRRVRRARAGAVAEAVLHARRRAVVLAAVLGIGARLHRRARSVGAAGQRRRAGLTRTGARSRAAHAVDAEAGLTHQVGRAGLADRGERED